MALEYVKWQPTSCDCMPSSRVRRRYVKNVVQRVACGAGKNEIAAEESREARTKTKWRLKNREFMPTGRVRRRYEHNGVRRVAYGADMNVMAADGFRAAVEKGGVSEILCVRPVDG
jgi:hypothetical protein